MESTEELKALKQENSKLKLEARLRKSLASELERQKSLVQEAKVEADAQRDKLQKASEQLSRYLSPQICEKIFSGAEFSVKSARKKLTIFFSDIAGFTTLSEQMEAEDLSNFLNFYLTIAILIAIFPFTLKIAFSDLIITYNSPNHIILTFLFVITIIFTVTT